MRKTHKDNKTKKNSLNPVKKKLVSNKVISKKSPKADDIITVIQHINTNLIVLSQLNKTMETFNNVLNDLKIRMDALESNNNSRVIAKVIGEWESKFTNVLFDLNSKYSNSFEEFKTLVLSIYAKQYLSEPMIKSDGEDAQFKEITSMYFTHLNGILESNTNNEKN